MNLLEAFELAFSFHGRQTDKNGDPYVAHLVRVMLRVQQRGGSDVQQIAALLHDSIEDGYSGRESLLRNGVPEDAVVLVEALTRPDGQPYKDYILSVLSTPDAVLVKQCDVEDNLDPGRLYQLPDAESSRLKRKYTWALEALKTPSDETERPVQERPAG